MKKWLLLFLLLPFAVFGDAYSLPQSMLGYIKSPHGNYGKLYWRPVSIYEGLRAGTLPDDWDWHKQGYKVPIHDQGGCGSCWADASTTCAKGTALIFGRMTLDLSVREVVAYDTEYDGCGGGGFAGGFIAKHGLVLDKDCPYGESYDRKCTPNPLTMTPAYQPASFVYAGDPDRSPTYDEVRGYIYTYGYTAVSAGADSTWNNYHGSDVNPSCRHTSVNHMIAAYAYHKAKQSLRIQNSWGEDFGDRAEPGTMEFKWGCYNFSEDAGAFVSPAVPCQPPKNAQLDPEYKVTRGGKITLSVPQEAGFTYEWHVGKSRVVGNTLVVSPRGTEDYHLLMTSSCGQAEIKTRVALQ